MKLEEREQRCFVACYHLRFFYAQAEHRFTITTIEQQQLSPDKDVDTILRYLTIVYIERGSYMIVQ